MFSNDGTFAFRNYLDLISTSSISDLYGQEASWSCNDFRRFHDSRKELYYSIGILGGFLPTMLRLGDRLYEVSLTRAVKYIVEKFLGTGA